MMMMMMMRWPAMVSVQTTTTPTTVRGPFTVTNQPTTTLIITITLALTVFIFVIVIIMIIIVIVNVIITTSIKSSNGSFKRCHFYRRHRRQDHSPGFGCSWHSEAVLLSKPSSFGQHNLLVDRLGLVLVPGSGWLLSSVQPSVNLWGSFSAIAVGRTGLPVKSTDSESKLRRLFRNP